MTPEAVARDMGVHIKSVYRWLAPVGDLACIRTAVGAGPIKQTRGVIRIRRVDYEAWLERHRSAAPEIPPAAPAPNVAERRAAFRTLPGAQRYVS